MEIQLKMNSFNKFSLRRIRFSLLLLGILFSICSCASKTQEPYPVPKNLRLAPEQRQEFVGLFLRGWWNEAEAVFSASIDNYISQDNFCAAARNYVLAARLLKYIGRDGSPLLEKARKLRNTGQKCPRVFNEKDEPVNVAKNVQYARMLESSAQTKSMLEKEKDPLYRSVYARKAADRALENKDFSLAEDFLTMARKVDAKHGWIVFLIEDWKYVLRFEKDRERIRQIRNRIQYLRKMIVPGGGIFSSTEKNNGP